MDRQAYALQPVSQWTDRHCRQPVVQALGGGWLTTGSIAGGSKAGLHDMALLFRRVQGFSAPHSGCGHRQALLRSRAIPNEDQLRPAYIPNEEKLHPDHRGARLISKPALKVRFACNLQQLLPHSAAPASELHYHRLQDLRSIAAPQAFALVHSVGCMQPAFWCWWSPVWMQS